MSLALLRILDSSCLGSPFIYEISAIGGKMLEKPRGLTDFGIDTRGFTAFTELEVRKFLFKEIIFHLHARIRIRSGVCEVFSLHFLLIWTLLLRLCLFSALKLMLGTFN